MALVEIKHSDVFLEEPCHISLRVQLLPVLERILCKLLKKLLLLEVIQLLSFLAVSFLVQFHKL